MPAGVAATPNSCDSDACSAVRYFSGYPSARQNSQTRAPLQAYAVNTIPTNNGSQSGLKERSCVHVSALTVKQKTATVATPANATPCSTQRNILRGSIWTVGFMR